MWTEERIAELKRLVEEEGLSSTLAAEKLGVSRNSVMGVCFRKKFKLKGSKQKIRKYTPKPVTWVPVVAPKRLLTKGKKLPSVGRLPMRHEEATKMAVHFEDLEKDMCRWPIWEHKIVPFSEKMFCGCKPMDGKPYCEAHAAIAFTPPRASTGRVFKLANLSK